MDFTLFPPRIKAELYGSVVAGKKSVLDLGMDLDGFDTVELLSKSMPTTKSTSRSRFEFAAAGCYALPG